MASKKETWLGCKNCHAICIVRNSYLRELSRHGTGFLQPSLQRSSLATGTGFNLNGAKREKVLRYELKSHNTKLGHTEALEAYCHRLRAQAEFVSTFAAQAA